MRVLGHLSGHPRGIFISKFWVIGVILILVLHYNKPFGDEEKQLQH